MENGERQENIFKETAAVLYKSIERNFCPV